MKPIFLVGYMGCGKTTMGRSLSKYLNISFIDLDLFIEARFRRSVKDIFNERGENGFRQIEYNVLREVGEFEDVIISCGGGTPCHYDNMEYMNSRGTTVFLNASHEALLRRLSIPTAKAKRPIIAQKSNEELSQFITEAMKQRVPHYTKASLIFDSSYLEDSSQVAESTENLAKQLISGS
ncbi:MAG: shikimate kinase [Bacteroidales bacterium]|nr:shikimate kinase [Bacteroidales bacterium]